MGPRRPPFTWAPVAGTGYNQVHLALREGMPRVGGWGPCRVTPVGVPKRQESLRRPYRIAKKKKKKKQLWLSWHSNQGLDPGAPARSRLRQRSRAGTARPGDSSVVVRPQIAKLRPRTSPRSSCTMGRGMGGVGGGRKLFLRGRKRESLELGSGSGHGAPAHFMPSPGTKRAPLCQAPCGPHLWAQRAAPSVAPDPLHFVSHPTGPRAPPAAPQAGSGQAAAGSSGCAPCPGGSPLPPAIPSPVLELRLELRGEP